MWPNCDLRNFRYWYSVLLPGEHFVTQNFMFGTEFCHFVKQSKILKFNTFKSFQATDLLLYTLKTSENQKFSDAFKGYRKKPVA